MDSSGKHLLKLQQLLLKTLRPNRLSQSDCLISSPEQLSNLSSEISPEYTLVYSGFFLDGIVTICITPQKKYTFIWALETLTYCLNGECQVPPDLIEAQSGEVIVTRILGAIENVNILTSSDEARAATIN